MYNIIDLDKIDSTNEYAKRAAKNGAEHWTVIRAKEQSAGKGRLGRTFMSEENAGIYMSILLKPDITPDMASRLTLVAAVAVRKALLRICKLECFIKWPNDIVADGRKVCGILTEMSTAQGRINYVVVGIGVNVTNKFFEEELSQVATSVYMLTGKEYDKDVLSEAILMEFEDYYKKYTEAGGMKAIKPEYDKYLGNIDKEVRVIDGSREIRGICRGIGEDGELLVEVKDNQSGENNEAPHIEKIISGEVSLRGVYGYV